MDPISLIVEALGAGAAEALKDGAKDAIVAAYQRLRDRVRTLLAGNRTAEVVLAEHEKSPKAWKEPLAIQLAGSGVAADPELRAAAEALLTLLKAPAAAPQYSIVAPGSQGIQVGSNTSQIAGNNNTQMTGSGNTQTTSNIGGAPQPRESTQPEKAGPEISSDPSRNVFVIHGRDEEARREVFTFLRALGLNPLEWEKLLQARGDAAPYLGQAIRTGLEAAAAVVVLMTPDDVTRLHPDLHGPREKPGEVNETLQPRPNVLIELGMALAAKPGKVVLLKVGDQREITDLNGHSYVRLSDTPECRKRIIERLKAAGCTITDSTDWLAAGDFASLKAITRTTA